MAKCMICGRVLKSPKSIARGMGSVCARKGGKKGGKGKRLKALVGRRGRGRRSPVVSSGGNYEPLSVFVGGDGGDDGEGNASSTT